MLSIEYIAHALENADNCVPRRYFLVFLSSSFYVYVCMYIRLKQLTNRNIDNTDNKRKSKR